MLKISTTTSFWFICLFLLGSATYPQGQDWPLKQRIDLSDGFGDFRFGRFHAGVDIRTGGRIGRRVYAPVDGSVWRVKMSYTGSGKALYILGDDGYIYVFYHLSRFANEIDRAVKKVQHEVQRYYIDHYFPEDSLVVTRGQVIATTGATGVGAPHLHFEKRTGDNQPVNPLNHGFELADTTRPVIRRLGIHLKDDHSLFLDGSRRLFLPVREGDNPGQYQLDSLLYMDIPFGVIVDSYDRIRPDGWQQTVRKLSFHVDGDLYYEMVLDSLDFETMHASSLVFDQSEAVDGNDFVRRLYHRPGNDFVGCRVDNKNSGIVGSNPALRFGLHQATLVAEDAFGNKSELRFGFFWGPHEGVYPLDSTYRPTDLSWHDFYFKPADHYQDLGIDSVVVQRYGGRDGWNKTDIADIFELPNGKLHVRINAKMIGPILFRLAFFTESGVAIGDQPFNGIIRKGYWGNVEIGYNIVEDGMIVTLTGPEKYPVLIRAELYRGDSLLAVVKEQKLSLLGDGHYVFVPPRPEFTLIDRIGIAAVQYKKPPNYWKDVYVAAVGYEVQDTLSIDSVFSVVIDHDVLYEPRFVAVRRDTVWSKGRWQLNSDNFTILPKVFATRKDFSIRLETNNKTENNRLSGLCWWDDEEDRWIWINADSLGEDHIGGTSMGGGMFAAVFDYYPPVISDLNLVPGRTVNTLQPTIDFKVEDTLSGILDDRNIDVRLNKQWCITEYDPETGRCLAWPYVPLEEGDCHLAIVVTDRAGNKSEQYLIFNVVNPESSKAGLNKKE